MLWLPLAILCGLVVWFLDLPRASSISTRVGVVLGLIEIGIFLRRLAVLLIINAGTPVNTLSVFIPGRRRLQPAFQGMVFCLLAFVGFEAAAPLGEETREPKRTIPRAVILSALLIGLFYIFNYYAATVYFGPDRMRPISSRFNDGDPWGGMADEVLPSIGGLLVTFAILNSCLANANAGANASTRSIFSLGPRRAPAAAGSRPSTRRTGRRSTRSTSRASSGSSWRSSSASLFQGEPRGGPLTTYVFIGYALGLLFAGDVHRGQPRVIGFYLGERRDEFNPIKHLVVPILGRHR